MPEMPLEDQCAHAERIRQALIVAAQEGYEHAAMSGLCHEGAWEAAISAMKMVDLEEVIAQEKDSPARDG
jgi:hypothetical protein